MTRQELLQRSSTLLGRFAHEVKVANAMGLFDINTIAEDFLIPVFKIAFDCPDLCNQNRIQMNFPAVDLGCKTSRTSIQISSDSSSSKVRETLEKFESHNLSSDFDSLYVYVITERQNSYSSQKLTESANSLSIAFDPSSNILDFRDLAKRFGELTNEQLESINGHLDAEFTKTDANLQFPDLGTLGSGKSPESPVIRASYGADLDLLDNKKDAKPILKLDINTYN